MVMNEEMLIRRQRKQLAAERISRAMTAYLDTHQINKADLARMVDIAPTTLGEWERNGVAEATNEKLLGLLKQINLDAAALFDGAPTLPTTSSKPMPKKKPKKGVKKTTATVSTNVSAQTANKKKAKPAPVAAAPRAEAPATAPRKNLAVDKISPAEKIAREMLSYKFQEILEHLDALDELESKKLLEVILSIDVKK